MTAAHEMEGDEADPWTDAEAFEFMRALLSIPGILEQALLIATGKMQIAGIRDAGTVCQYLLALAIVRLRKDKIMANIALNAFDMFVEPWQKHSLQMFRHLGLVLNAGKEVIHSRHGHLYRDIQELAREETDWINKLSLEEVLREADGISRQSKVTNL